MFDLIIRGGCILDGSGNPSLVADVGIVGERIAAIGDLSAAVEAGGARVIEAHGKVVCPGFIDMHSHSDLALLAGRAIDPKVRQGITTEVIGQDGIAAAPMAAEHIPRWRQHLAALNGDPPVSWRWRSFDDYLDELAAAGVAQNVVAYVPHGNVRLAVMGVEGRPATDDELRRMQQLVRESHEQGAFALSTGLTYMPCSYSDERELAALAEATAEAGGFFVTHMRNEGVRILEAMQEMLGAARPYGCPVHISHFQIAGRRNFHKLPEVFALLDRAPGDGVDVTFDQYPYTAGSTMMSSLLPPFAHAGGTDMLLARLSSPEQRTAIREAMLVTGKGWQSNIHNVAWDQIFVAAVASEANAVYVGQSVAAVAERRGTDPFDTVFDLVLEEANAVSMVSFYQGEEIVRAIMRHPLHTVSTDGLLSGSPHPRVYGSFPRILGHYVRDEKVLSLAEAVHHMTGSPARRLGLRQRGLIREGYFADITVFDPGTVIDRATYANPKQFPIGITHVLVNGRLVVDDERVCGALAGRVLRKGRDS